MCDYIKRFLECLEPIIKDLEIKKEELDKIKEELDSTRDLLRYTENDIKKIGKYDNQDFINNNLINVDSEINEYQAMVYLVDSDNPSIQKIPQYQVAVKYLENILDYFNISEKSLNKLFLDLSDEYYYKSLAKKYYDLFQQEELYVLEHDEFVKFFLTLDIEEEDKRNILCYVIKNNVNYYKNNTIENYEVDRKQELMKIQEIIHDNRSLMSDKYNNFMEGASKRLDLSINIRKLVNEEVLNKIDINNLVLAKIIYLTHKITQCYKSCEFGLVSKYIKEYDELMNLKEKIKNINNKEEIIGIVKGGY